MLYIFHDIENYTDEEYQHDLGMVSEERREKALSFYFMPDRKRCVKAYILLARGLKQEYGLKKVPEFSYGKYGKPYLKGFEGIYFSLSHCGSSVLCVIDEVPVGADIEDNIEDMELMRTICSSEEIARIDSSAHPENAFASCFTAKESCAKLTGRGLIDLEDTLRLPSEDNERFVFERMSFPEKGYAYSICRYRDAVRR